MSGVEKCCSYFQLDLGCIVLGISSFIFNKLMVLLSILWLTLDSSEHYNLGIMPVEFTKVSLSTILIITCIMGLLGIVASVFLGLGIRQNRPSYLLCYFSYAILITILAQLGALLFLLEGHWQIALVQFIVSCVFIYFATVVHTTYDLMLSGKRFGINLHESDTQILITN